MQQKVNQASACVRSAVTAVNVRACLSELEGLIFDCVLYMDELKEHAEQIQEDVLTREPSPSPARSSSPSGGRENLSHPQVPNSTTRIITRNFKNQISTFHSARKHTCLR